MIYTGKSAEVTQCGQYRYFLFRWWNARISGRACMFVGVNPSTADAMSDDHTITKMAGFAWRWGFDGLVVGNLFAYRATDVDLLRSAADPVGPDNDGWLLDMMNLSNLIVPCWGSRNKLPRHLRHRISDVEQLLAKTNTPIKCLGETISKDPRHPLMLGYDTELVPYEL